MRKIVFFTLCLFCAVVSAAEITGYVRRIYPQSGKIYFALDETPTPVADRCHNTTNSYYYSIHADKKALTTDTEYYEKKFQSVNYFSLLMLSASTKDNTDPSKRVKVIIGISDYDKLNSCGTGTIHINYLKAY